jgi:type IV secretion system protein VirB4
LLDAEKVTVTRGEDAVWSALNSLASGAAAGADDDGAGAAAPINALRTAIQPYTLDGPHGRLLDAAESGLAFADVQCFETEALLGQASVFAPVLTYLFHRLEERFDGRPTLLVLDEAWIFLDHPLFAARIREWLKTLRKKNVAVLFATQSLADIADSSIAPAIIESCPQRILLPNDRAIEPQSRPLRTVRAQRPADRAGQPRDPQAALLSAIGARQSLFELGLGPIALALCGASDPASQKRIDAFSPNTRGRLRRAASSLRRSRLGRRSDRRFSRRRLTGFPQPPAPGE